MKNEIRERQAALLWAAILSIWTYAKAATFLKQNFRFRRCLDTAYPEDSYIKVYPLDDWNNQRDRMKEGRELWEPRFTIYPVNGEGRQWMLVDWCHSCDYSTDTHNEKEYGPFKSAGEAALQLIRFEAENHQETLDLRRDDYPEFRRFKGEVKKMS